jgi:hypothetical protein
MVRKDDQGLLARELAEILDKTNLQDTASYVKSQNAC